MTPWLLVIALHVGASELTIGLRNEDRIGAVPLITTASGQGQSVVGTAGTATTVSFELIPNITFKLKTRLNELAVSYQPQLLVTRAFGTTRTLGLHSGNLTYSHRLTRDLSMNANAGGTIGNLDFYRARRQLNPAQATILSIPENSVISYMSANAYLGLAYMMGRFTRLEAGAVASHAGPALGQNSSQFFRVQDSLGATARLSRQITKSDTIGLLGEYRWVWFEGGPYYTSATPEVFVRHRFTRRLSLDAHAGVQLSGTRYGPLQIRDWVLGEGVLPRRVGTERRYMPTFGLTVGALEVRGPGYWWTSALTVNLLPFYDPVQGVLQQRLAVGSTNLITLSRTSSLRVDFSVYVPADVEFGGTSNQPFVDQDVFAILNPVYVRRLDPMLNMEVGLLLTQRWEDYTEVVGSWYRPEFVLYIAFVGRTKVW